MSTAASWGTVREDDAHLADHARARFAAGGEHVLATRTLIGTPRLSAARVGWWGDEMWFGCSEGAARDLRADARVGLLAAPDGDRADEVKVSGRAVELVGDARAAVVDGCGAEGELFVLRVRSVALTVPSLLGPARVLRWDASSVT
ncbi:hypothetical protein [Sanguibacter suaedae]|uniref:Pyridoxamine 5'-phosphate oxidase family protein n=1 Tax=Sanguibacter suaedae TaxID=2795737 RepID=A0A934IAA1_9MICO|nr:hypothetical protein [Sanguibacter suaedae]MBI9115055.1 hypothetical protein [Sanguibacter suaedae]